MLGLHFFNPAQAMRLPPP
ncbi:hypothetical protein AB0K74_46290 [Streptomyces sp. NPDC056159]